MLERLGQLRPDSNATQCACCQSSFGIVISRRRHCRNCGLAVCTRCSDQKMPVPRLGFQIDVRVCDTCVEILVAEKEEQRQQNLVMQQLPSMLTRVHTLSFLTVRLERGFSLASAVSLAASKSPQALRKSSQGRGE